MAGTTTTTARSGSARLPDGREAEEFVLEDGRGMAARVGTYGARLLSLRVPDRAGAPVDVVLGYDRLEDWARDDGFLGATIGRFANRIARGRFELEGRSFQVPINNPPNALHGGPQGFDKAVWRAQPAGSGAAAALTLTHTSPDGDQGFPGALRATVRYALTGDGALALDYTAETDRPTLVNLTNHAYFNLAGGGDVLEHLLTIDADRFTPVDAALIPTGELRPVAGTPFDFRAPARIGARVDEPGDEQLRIAGGYDHNFVLRPAPPGGGGAPRFAARVEEPARGVSLEIWTTEPGVQFYSGNSLDGSRRGRGGAPLERRGGFCLETQHFPDSPNRPGFPSVVLRPGETFRSSTLYRFAVAS